MELLKATVWKCGIMSLACSSTSRNPSSRVQDFPAVFMQLFNFKSEQDTSLTFSIYIYIHITKNCTLPLQKSNTSDWTALRSVNSLSLTNTLYCCAVLRTLVALTGDLHELTIKHDAIYYHI